jgi:L-alanine-DL-glutamate epimerase-like enolase superfamily enzyme
MYRERAQIKDGYTYLNDKPGFGIEIDWMFIENHKD